MVSAKGLVYYSPGTKDLLATCPADAPLVVQLFGCEPEMIRRAMDTLLDRGFLHFDLNCGCSVPKVVKTGSGAALLKTPDLLRRIAGIMVEKAGPGHVGVKLRTGWDAHNIAVFDIAHSLEDVGAAWLTLHPRHARQGYSGTAEWEHIAELKRRATVPVLASGDLFSAMDARRCLEMTGADGVMLARGALYDPTIFRHHIHWTAPPPPPSGPDIATLIARHAALIQEHGRPERALMRMRSIVPRYIRHLLGARALRQEMASCTTWTEFEDIVGRITNARPAPGPERFQEKWDGSS